VTTPQPPAASGSPLDLSCGTSVRSAGVRASHLDGVGACEGEHAVQAQDARAPELRRRIIRLEARLPHQPTGVSGLADCLPGRRARHVSRSSLGTNTTNRCAVHAKPARLTVLQRVDDLSKGKPGKRPPHSSCKNPQTPVESGIRGSS
jgi:hypothetical protein